MILGIGIDAVEIERFKDWHTKPVNQLMRIFSAEEIAYCLKALEKALSDLPYALLPKKLFTKHFVPGNRLSLPLIAYAKQ